MTVEYNGLIESAPMVDKFSRNTDIRFTNSLLTISRNIICQVLMHGKIITTRYKNDFSTFSRFSNFPVCFEIPGGFRFSRLLDTVMHNVTNISNFKFEVNVDKNNFDIFFNPMCFGH